LLISSLDKKNSKILYSIRAKHGFLTIFKKKKKDCEQFTSDFATKFKKEDIYFYF